MNRKIVINLDGLLCGLLVFMQLLPNQMNRLFNISSDNIFRTMTMLNYAFLVFMIAYALSKKSKTSRAKVCDFIHMIMPLFVLMLVTEAIAIISSPVVATYGVRYFTRSLSEIISRFSIWAVVLCVWSLRGKDAIGCLTGALVFDQILILVLVSPQVGMSGIIESLQGAFLLVEGTSNSFEVHELTFAIGMVLIYYLFFKPYKDRKDFWLVVFFLFSFLLGAKRIGIAGIAAAFVFSFFVRKRGLSSRSLFITGLIGMGICIAYLTAIYNDSFLAMLSNYGVNVMGRNLIWGYFTKRTTFHPSNLGWGIAGVSKAIENMNRSEVSNMVDVRGMHNDILKIYVNYGFVLGLSWLWINLISIPKKLFKAWGKHTATVFMALSLYLFVTYLTDNTEGYWICQISLLLISVTEYSANEEKRE